MIKGELSSLRRYVGGVVGLNNMKSETREDRWKVQDAFREFRWNECLLEHVMIDGLDVVLNLEPGEDIDSHWGKPLYFFFTVRPELKGKLTPDQFEELVRFIAGEVAEVDPSVSVNNLDEQLEESDLRPFYFRDGFWCVALKVEVPVAQNSV